MIVTAALLLAVATLAAIISTIVTERSIRWARERGELDHGTARSSHAEPTPRLGGVGIAGGMLLAMAVLWTGALAFKLDEWIPHRDKLVCMLCVFGAFLLGVWDDRRGMAPLPKLAGQLAIATVAALLGPRVGELSILGATIDMTGAPGALLTFASVLAMMNVINFVDGINGLAGRLAQGIGLGVIALSLLQGSDPHWALIAAALAGASTGFLVFNLPRPQTFMGDGGSQCIGAAVGMVMVGVAADTPERIPAEVPLLLVLVPLFDVGFTMIRRAGRGANLLEGHREHLYQRFLIAAHHDHDAARRNTISFAGLAMLVAVTVPWSDHAAPLLWTALIAIPAIYWWSVRSEELRANQPTHA